MSIKLTTIDRKELFKTSYNLIENEKNKLVCLLNERVKLLEEYYFNECKIIKGTNYRR